MTITIKTHEDHITVQAPFSPAFRDACKSIDFGWWNAGKRAWCYPLSQARTIAERFYGQHPCTDHEFDELVDAETPVEMSMALFGETTPPSLVKTKPWAHQLIAYNLIKNNTATMLAHDMGVGKSKVIVDYVVNAGLKLTLIVCPKAVVQVWKDEFAKHAARPVEVLTLGEGRVDERARKAQQAIRLRCARGNQLVLVVNVDSVWRAALAEIWKTVTLWNLVVVDESHRIKSSTGRASKFLWRLGKRAERRVCLTGTPMAHSPLDVFGQYRFLDDRIYGGFYTRFKSRYAVLGGYIPQGRNGRPVQVVGYRNIAELRDKFASIAHQVRKQDVLDLPPVVHETRQVDMSVKAWGHYRQLERDLVTQVEQGLVTVANAAVKVGKLQQVTSGFLKVDREEVGGEEVYQEIDNAKAKALTDVFEDLPPDEPVVVFCRFRHDLDTVKAVAEKAGRTCFSLRGGLNELAEWQAARRGEVLAVQIQAGGVGVSFARACYCVYFSPGWSLGDYEQSLARLDRPGQTRSVTYIHLVATGPHGEGTIDERIYAALQSKRDVIDAVLEGLGTKKRKDVA